MDLVFLLDCSSTVSQADWRTTLIALDKLLKDLHNIKRSSYSSIHLAFVTISEPSTVLTYFDQFNYENVSAGLMGLPCVGQGVRNYTAALESLASVLR